MYFAVTSMIDAEQRHQFFAPILDEVERILAVHAVYLTVRDIVLPNAPAARPRPHIPTPAPPPDAAGDADAVADSGEAAGTPAEKATTSDDGGPAYPPVRDSPPDEGGDNSPRAEPPSEESPQSVAQPPEDAHASAENTLSPEPEKRG